MRKVNETDTAARQVPFFTNSQLHWEFCAVSIVKGFPLIVSPYMSASRARDHSLVISGRKRIGAVRLRDRLRASAVRAVCENSSSGA